MAGYMKIRIHGRTKEPKLFEALARRQGREGNSRLCLLRKSVLSIYRNSQHTNIHSFPWPCRFTTHHGVFYLFRVDSLRKKTCAPNANYYLLRRPYTHKHAHTCVSSTSRQAASRSILYVVLQTVRQRTALDEKVERHTSTDCTGRFAAPLRHMRTTPSSPPV